jgi:hypothetical protein
MPVPRCITEHRVVEVARPAGGGLRRLRRQRGGHGQRRLGGPGRGQALQRHLRRACLGEQHAAVLHHDDARWLLDWIGRTGRAQFSRRDAHAAAPRGRFPKATDLEPPLRLLEEHGYLRRVDPEPSRDPHGRGRPASPRFLVNLLPRATETTETTKPPPDPFLWILWFPWTVAGVPTDGSSGRRHRAREGGRDRASGSPRAVTLSNENGLSRSRPSQQTRPAPNDRRRPLLARRNSHCRRGSHPPGKSQLTPMRTGCPWSRDR